MVKFGAGKSYYDCFIGMAMEVLSHKQNARIRVQKNSACPFVNCSNSNSDKEKNTPKTIEK